MRPLTVAVTLGDAYARLSDLVAQPGAPPRLVEGFVQAQTEAAVLRFGDESTPPTGEVGLLLAASAALGVGPVLSPDAAWMLDRIWARNAAAGSNATLVVQGVVA